MNTHRLMATAMMTFAAGLSLAACTAGITTATPTKSHSPATGGTPSSPTPSSTESASTGPADTVSVDAPIGSFPIPSEAKVFFNSDCGKDVIIELSSVTPSEVSSFYISELPRAGYKITSNTLENGSGATGLPGSAAGIDFTGHGYKGQIAALSDLGALASASPDAIPSSIAKNFITIMLTPPGPTGCNESTP